MNILTTIVDRKRERLEKTKREAPLNEIKARIRDMEETRDFAAAIRRDNNTIKLIAEIKKASPSKGLIRADFDPAAIALIYDSSPVAALSILTEEDFFQGDLTYIKTAKKATSKPVLRKDFIFDEYQLFEARANGADAVLLIANILGNVQASEFYCIASELGMAALFEVHNEEELDMAHYVDAEIVGINNRDLKTLEIDLSTTLRLKKLLPVCKIVVAESGIRTRQDVITLRDNSIDAMLIGTSFMESPDIRNKIDELMAG
jgi:indole-3-glycerol phosphate synthase